ncbi:MAG: hypothetical protein KDC73_05740 [Ignavibacteriae bacterium]|nr:hypothetical protein [Ignavibacteriota bacterium]MCB9243772.1 hypothetical protein [Ignavibacteriales bacterium]
MAQKPIDNISIKVLGKWNTKLFQPEWIINNLFEDRKQIIVLFNFEEREIGFKVDDIVFFPKDDKMIIQIEPDEDTKEFKEDSMIIGTKLMLKILKLLPHTPIESLDFDISFLLDKDDKFSKFITDSSGKLINDFIIDKYRLNKKSDDYNLDILVSKEKDEKFKVIFVFQYNNYKNLKDDILVYNLKESIKLLNGKE